MSYCRFSTDDFQCDLYCYESVNGNYETQVASNRFRFKIPLPEKVDVGTNEWFKRHDKIMEMVKHADKVKIGLPYDGKYFSDSNIEDFYNRLLELKRVGYQFPDYVLEQVKSEIKND